MILDEDKFWQLLENCSETEHLSEHLSEIMFCKFTICCLIEASESRTFPLKFSQSWWQRLIEKVCWLWEGTAFCCFFLPRIISTLIHNSSFSTGSAAAKPDENILFPWCCWIEAPNPSSGGSPSTWCMTTRNLITIMVAANEGWTFCRSRTLLTSLGENPLEHLRLLLWEDGCGLQPGGRTFLANWIRPRTKPARLSTPALKS